MHIFGVQSLTEVWVSLVRNLAKPRNGLNLETLLDFTSEELINHLDKFHFDWENTEAFADFLILLSNKTGETKLKEKALTLYNYTQSESKTFSLEIFNKIASLKAQL